MKQVSPYSWDMHSHALPGLDDGAEDWEESLEMARVAVACGTTRMVLTPHYLAGVYEPEAATIRSLTAEFRKRLLAAGVSLVVLEGCEAFLSPEIPELLGAGRLTTLADKGGYVLVELPAGELPSWAGQVLFHIRVRGVVPILAHPERNVVLSARPQLLQAFIQQGVLVQVNGASLTGHHGRAAQKAAEQWLRYGWVHMLGSDAHAPQGWRSPDLRAAIARLRRLRLDLAPAITVDIVRPQEVASYRGAIG